MLKEFVNLLFEITLKNDFIIRVNLSAMCKIKKKQKPYTLYAKAELRQLIKITH